MSYPAASARAFQYRLFIFTLTALLGLANTTQLFGALDRNTLLTHLHSGTLGWITMGVIGVSIWIFGGSGSTLARNVMPFERARAHARDVTGLASIEPDGRPGRG